MTTKQVVNITDSDNECFTQGEYIDYNKELITLALKNDTQNRGKIFLKKNKEYITSLNVTCNMTISINVILNGKSGLTILDIPDFNSDDSIEKCFYTDCSGSYKFILHKRNSSLENFKITDFEVDENNEMIKQKLSKYIPLAQTLAECCLIILLLSLDDFLKEFSENLNIKKYGYVNF